MTFKAVYGCCLALLVASGCATSTVELKPSHPYGKATDPQQLAWHHLRFKWSWPRDQRPHWSLDPLVADMVLSDPITRHQASLPLWRFHRRAGRSPAGHQFSFIFYTTPGVAREIENWVTDHAVTRRLLDEGLLEKVYLTRPERPSSVSATSDPGWPEPVQATWPMFIMGVSQTWLGLVEVHAGSTTGLENDLHEAMARYERVNEEVDELWYEYAQHAFFHHLSGVFGYQPVAIHKRMRF